MSGIEARINLWKRMQQMDSFTLKDLPGDERFVKRYVNALQKAGYLERENWEEKRGRFRLIQNTGAQAPIVKRGDVVIDLNRESSNQTKLWQGMRILKTFTLSELALCAQVPQISQYLSFLCRAGFVVRVAHGKGRGAKAVYRLARNTGPLAPVMSKRNTVIFDPNTNINYPIGKQMTEASNG